MRCGLTPAAEELDPTASHGDPISHEFIAEADPNWLFVLDRGAAIGADVQSARRPRPRSTASWSVKGTTAWTEDQMVYLPASNVYLAAGGYTSLMEILDGLEARAFGMRLAAGLGLAALLVLMPVSVGVGAADISVRDAWTMLVLMESRTLAVVLSGAALAVSGTLIQSLVRNRFVGPDTSGTSESSAPGCWR